MAKHCGVVSPEQPFVHREAFLEGEPGRRWIVCSGKGHPQRCGVVRIGKQLRQAM
jgi:hypothetical protein